MSGFGLLYKLKDVLIRIFEVLNGLLYIAQQHIEIIQKLVPKIPIKTQFMF